MYEKVDTTYAASKQVKNYYTLVGEEEEFD